MIKIHEKAARGRTQAGWLDSYHTFSFGGFSDPTRMGFGNLRVINDDTVIPGAGFAAHDHDSMDILTLVTAGHLRHEDDQGNISMIGAGEIQGMSAGSGVRHSEFNASDRDSARFLQIWLIPDEPGGAPSYVQTAVPERGDVLLAGPAASGALIPLRSATTLTLRRFAPGGALLLDATPGLHRFVHLLDGLAVAETERVSAGDGLQVPAGETLALSFLTDAAVLVFDMLLTSQTKETVQ
ncbi:MAG: pirin family protein [Pseudomonadota bacterium]